MTEATKLTELLIEVQEEGKGDEHPQPHDEVTVHYTGTLLADGSKFDSSRDRGQPFKFTIGKGQVIQGWDEGVAKMKRGERSLLKIPSDMGYGARGSPPKIPENADLQFDVELIDFAPKDPEAYELSEEDQKVWAEKKKLAGTEAQKANNLEVAIVNYQKALEYGESDDAIIKSCNLNLSMCYIKLGQWDAVIPAATKALEVEEQNVKALYRRGWAYSELKEFDLAKQDLKYAVELDPKNKEVRDKYASNLQKIKEYKAKEKASFGSIFAKDLYTEKAAAAPGKLGPIEHVLSELPLVYMDIRIGEEGSETSQTERVHFSLYNDSVPKTSENFRKLCLGDAGMCTTKPDTPLAFKGSKFHRVIPGFMMQGGDFTHGSGQGGESIYGEKFEDEDFSDKHTKKCLLSMANAGPGTNGSQFFVTFTQTPHLDGKHVVFGEVVSGFELIDKCEQVKTGAEDVPQDGGITIVDCGEVTGEEKETFFAKRNGS